MRIFGIEIDLRSFWIGAVVASIFWAIILSLRPVFETAMEALRKQREEAKARVEGGIETTHRRIVYKQAQEMHIASSIFALDEIIQTPRLLAPPPQVEPGIGLYHEDIVSQAIPYMPDWPEVAAFYQAESLSLEEALSNENHLIFIGQPGTGKTTTLAYLAAQLANRALQVESLEERIPVLIHAANLGLPRPEAKKPEELLAPLVEDETSRAPLLSQSSIPNFLATVFQSGRALLLLDGVDELPPPQIQEVAAYLRLLLRAYPKTRIIATASTEYADGLIGLGMVPLVLMPWGKAEQSKLLDTWDQLWKKQVASQTWAQATDSVDTLLLKRWLGTENANLTPLEYTLKVWAGYAGDIRGPRGIDAIESHLRRLIPAEIPVAAAEMLGAQTSQNAVAFFDQAAAQEWIKAFETSQQAAIAAAAAETSATAEAPADETETEPETDAKGKDKPKAKGSKPEKKKPGPQPQSILGRLSSYGLLQPVTGAKLRFSHPVFAAFLAARGASKPEEVAAQANWSGRNLTMRYMAAYYDISPLVQNMLAEKDHILHRPQLGAAHLLREAPRNVPWRGMVMKALVELIQNEDLPVALRAQAMAGCVFSGEAGMGALFRQLLMTDAPEIRRLAALGVGMLRDTKSVETLTAVLTESYGRAQMAIFLALVSIGSQQALEAVALGLLRGDEDMRRYAAEALANHPTEGHEALRDGIHSEDILVRRAIIYGLARVHEPWADEILANTQVQEQQWVVRNAAVELMEIRSHPNPRVPRRLTQPSETPWILELAGRYGMGVAPGQPATDIFLLALKGDNADERAGALNYLRLTPSDGVIAAMYPFMYGDDPELKEDVYRCLAQFGYSGIKLPDPMQFGLG